MRQLGDCVSRTHVLACVASGETGKVPPDATSGHAAPVARRNYRTRLPLARGRAAFASPREFAVDPQCVARHRVTREKRVWRDRDTCVHWFQFGKHGLNIADWDLADEWIPFWGSGMPHPKEDGTDGLGPLYDTADHQPADGSTRPARR